MTKTHTDVRIHQEELEAHILGPWAEDRRKVRKLMEDPIFHYQFNLTKEEQRELTLKQLQELADRKIIGKAYPKEFGGEENPGANIAGFSEMFHANPSMQIKGGVQWGLFGSAVLHLGSAEHHDRFLPGIMDLSVPGVFAMTEIGHGSDVASIGTTATYDPEAEEFVLNTPFRAAWKEYLGNAAKHGVAAVVFAQLITKGVNHGVHAFYVPIRTVGEDGSTEMCPGVQSEDDGHKGGLNGIDNGRLAFDNVRVPRENLLNRYGDVAADGTYSSEITSPGRRFFTMLGTLVQGRVSLSGAATVASKMALTTAIRYGEERRQFVSTDENRETVLMDYQRHQHRLLPLLARTYASQFMHNQLLERFDDVFSGRHDSDEDRQDLETLAAASKAAATWLALEAIQESREACGGAGYMSENRLTGLYADLDVYVTFEGDNNVLLQLVGKRLLTDSNNIYAVESSGAKGLSGARNSGVLAATGEVVAFLDDDAEAGPDWLARQLRLYADPAVLGVGGRVDPLWEQGRPRHFPPELDWIVGCSHQGLPHVAAEVRNVIGASMSFRRIVFERAGLFDEKMGRDATLRSCEETELCIRAVACMPNGRIVYEPESLATHHVPTDRGTLHYMMARAWGEGLSKGYLSRSPGRGPKLGPERRYMTTTLPRAVARGLLSGDAAGLACSGSILAVLAATGTAYARERLRPRRPAASI